MTDDAQDRSSAVPRRLGLENWGEVVIFGGGGLVLLGLPIVVWLTETPVRHDVGFALVCIFANIVWFGLWAASWEAHRPKRRS